MVAKQFEPSGFRLKPSLLREADGRSPPPASNACKVSASLKYKSSGLSGRLNVEINEDIPFCSIMMAMATACAVAFLCSASHSLSGMVWQMYTNCEVKTCRLNRKFPL